MLHIDTEQKEACPEDALATPVYLVDERALEKNLKILAQVAMESGAHILLAQKAFSMFAEYPLIAAYLSGATASGLYEARLAYEELHVKRTSEEADSPVERDRMENHVFSPAFTEGEMAELVKICDHISFNSLSQLEKHRAAWERAGISVGLRINPEFSTQDGHAIYDPCAPFSRLGITRENFPKNPADLPAGVEGLHIHTLCEQNFRPLLETWEAVEEKFGGFLKLPQIKWVNLGGGHHITRPNYDRAGLVELVRRIRANYQVDVYLEPGEAVALNAGTLITEVMDIVDNGMPILILDTSAACHMPDVLEMPYRPPLRDSGMPGELAVTCRLSSRTCLSGDVIGDYSFEELPKVGDRLVFEDMAIYSMVKNNTFNGMPLPDIAVKRKDGSVEVVKKFGYEDFKGRLS